jgi:predicted nuclease of restriction endonuclease-like RecB superfamily
MLPSELLIARTYKGTIKPVFSPLTEGRIQMAEDLINTFVSFVDKKKGEEVLTSVASSLNVSVSELERSLWADYEEELILKDFITSPYIF